MKKINFLLLLIMLPLVASAYDIAVQNAAGVTIYYNYTNEGKELEVSSRGSRTYSGDVVIPAEVTYMNRTRKVTGIGKSAFTWCADMTSVTIPSSVTSIGEEAFYGCSGLTSVAIPSSVTNMGRYAFYRCEALTSLTIPEGITSIGDYAFQSCRSLPSVTIPSSVTSIGNYAFSECEALTSVTISEGVRGIGDYAFHECEALPSITIPSSVINIGRYAFYKCGALTSVTILEGVTAIWEGAFYQCYSLPSVTIPSSVTSIERDAFYECTGLISVTISEGVTTIGREAFMHCEDLTSVTIPSSVTSIGNYAFSECYGLTSVTLSEGVTSIGEYAFHYSSLNSLTIPSTVTSIGDRAFEGVDIPTIISLIENPFAIYGKTSSRRAFSQNTYNNATLYVPEGTIDKYKATEGWKDFLFIEESGTPPTPPTPEKCETPTIGYSNGKLTFSCATEGATCYYSITDADIKSGSGSNVQLEVTYNISVYAAKEGCENSEKATATLCWIEATPQAEGLDGMAKIAARPILIKAENGLITVEGADDSTNVSIYATDGKQMGSAISRNNAATIATNLRPGSVAIVRVGEKGIKVLVK